ncbi:MAG: 1-deoxy-D-xylulose-5-phosphate reductoisomerase [Betaproteobacteria bacterium]|nr:1-deoxy-D-xylulose-5-phosphate reductoisomerase [Betaproteobacteria bacterium]NBY72579.1 1-deoxy-D-xylulose-5-phosphate reductoisomerase [Betaproteobacteria bacterium]NDD11350.1 1-deoxy-D-xylulose-5-phosphate reductoisomerase [Betaproteobacteria bacterium]
MKQKLVILGSTGSIGVNTLDVTSRHPEKFEVFALTAATRVELLFQQCLEFRPRFAVMTSSSHAAELSQRLKASGSQTQVMAGPEALIEMASHEEVDMVMAAIVGAAGLGACLAAARSAKRLLLANKEALVVGGAFFMKEVQQGGATLLPIDSEHSAIFQSLPDDAQTWPQRIGKIILTASGGPFRTRKVSTLKDVLPEEACAHPNWVMGRKISVDSATMMNKALEVIEAHYLFGMPPEHLEVVIHPESIIHSMVQFKDHSIVAQLGTPDMRVPIAYGMSWPHRMESGAQALNFETLKPMTFESLTEHEHPQRFPGLQLAWHALRAPSGYTAVLNAANEVAVASFLDLKIRFDQIAQVNQHILSSMIFEPPSGLEDLIELDVRSRNLADQYVQHIRR